VTALAIAAAVRGRTASARASVADALDRIAAHDAGLNAFTSILADRAMARADVIDAAIAAGNDPGPLAGVPFAAKNLFDVAGIVTRAGASVTANDPVARRDADAIAALERQGAVLVGLTNMDEFAYGFVTENAHDGATRNPHDPSRIAGGSSGGSAAAVAAEFVPLSLASDTNGSIRVPAALCGIFGIRPTFGTISCRGAYPFVHSLDTVGPLARTASDLRAAFSALVPDHARREPERRAPRCARLGGYFDERILPKARRAVDVVCAALDVTVVVELAHAREAREAAFVMTAAEGGALHADRLRAHAEEFDPATRDRLIAGALMPAAWYLRAQRFRSFFSGVMRGALAEHDVLVAAATPFPATRIGQRTIVVEGRETDIRPDLGVFTQPISLAGVPVVSVPVVEVGALPVGVQLVGRAGSENLLLHLAEELERRGVVGAAPVPVPA
jgi:aspartyl-tRNA(Asn)/glutamyl-tRNA(Gln) amidotransferase subunit A